MGRMTVQSRAKELSLNDILPPDLDSADGALTKRLTDAFMNTNDEYKPTQNNTRKNSSNTNTNNLKKSRRNTNQNSTNKNNSKANEEFIQKQEALLYQNESDKTKVIEEIIFKNLLTAEEVAELPTLDIDAPMENSLMAIEIPEGAVIGVLRNLTGGRWTFMLYNPDGTAAAAGEGAATNVMFFNDSQMNPFTREAVTRDNFQLYRVHYTEEQENVANFASAVSENEANFASAMGNSEEEQEEAEDQEVEEEPSNENAENANANENEATEEEFIEQLLETIAEHEDLEGEFNEIALEAQTPLGDADNAPNMLLRAAGTLLEGMRVGAERTDEYGRLFLVAAADLIEAGMERIDEAARPAVMESIRSIRETATTVSSNVKSAVGTAIQLLLTHLGSLFSSAAVATRETMFCIVMIIYKIGRRSGLSLRDAIVNAAKCIARAGSAAAESVIAGLWRIPPMVARVGGGALDLGGRMVRSGTRWVWDRLVEYRPIVLDALDRGQRNVRTFLQEQGTRLVKALIAQVRSAIKTATPIVKDALKKLLKSLKKNLVLLMQAIQSKSLSLARIGLVYLRILAEKAAELTGSAIQLGANFIVEGTRTIFNGLVGIGQGLLQGTREQGTRERMAERATAQQVQRAMTVVRDAGEQEVVPKLHLRKKKGAIAQTIEESGTGIPVPYGTNTGNVFKPEVSRTTAAEPARMVLRNGRTAAAAAPEPEEIIRQKNAPIVKTLEEAGQPVPYGFRKGDRYKPGLSGGKKSRRRRTMKRRKNARKTRKARWA